MIAKAKKMDRKKQETKHSGNYQIVGGDYGLSIANVNSQELFNHLYRDEKLDERARVLVYMDETAMNNSRGFAINLATGFARYGGSYFKTRVVTKQEPESARYAEYADVVINAFGLANEEFESELEKYNDGAREFLDIMGAFYETKRLSQKLMEVSDEESRRHASVRALEAYVYKLKNRLQTSREESLEKIVA